MNVASNITAEFSGVIGGAGGLTNSQSGTLILSGNNTNSGSTILNSGTLALGHDNALGTGTLNFSGGTRSRRAAPPARSPTRLHSLADSRSPDPSALYSVLPRGVAGNAARIQSDRTS